MREAIVKELVGAVKEMAGNGYSVTAQETTKNNGVKMLGIEIRKPEETVVPRLYVDGIVDRVEDGFMTAEDAAKKVFEMYQNSETPEIDMNVEKLIDRKFILDHVEYRLVNPGPEIEEPDGPQMYVLTNARKLHGANIMLYKEYLEIAAEKMNGDFYIIPSSIHELIAVPVSAQGLEELREMVKAANDNQLAPEEILGYEVYRYNRETGEVEVAV